MEPSSSVVSVVAMSVATTGSPTAVRGSGVLRHLPRHRSGCRRCVLVVLVGKHRRQVANPLDRYVRGCCHSNSGLPRAFGVGVARRYPQVLGVVGRHRRVAGIGGIFDVRNSSNERSVVQTLSHCQVTPVTPPSGSTGVSARNSIPTLGCDALRDTVPSARQRWSPPPSRPPSCSSPSLGPRRCRSRPPSPSPRRRCPRPKTRAPQSSAKHRR